jgi:histidinol dehydrogenase
MSTFDDKAPRDTLRVITPEEVRTLTFDPVDALARDQASAILNEVQTQGVEGLLNVAVRLRDIESRESKIFYSPEDLKVAFESLDSSVQKVLERTAARIRLFAENQRASLQNMTMVVPGGEAGHTVEPIQVAGCYAPGGRYPLPSSVLMTAVTARAAGVPNVYVASPRPAPATLGAAYVAKADGLLAIGGAGAIGAFAYGLKGNGSNCPSMPAADVIVGPGNKWVTAAKSIVSGIVGIDMLAGPSEVLVIADET